MFFFFLSRSYVQCTTSNLQFAASLNCVTVGYFWTYPTLPPRSSQPGFTRVRVIDFLRISGADAVAFNSPLTGLLFVRKQHFYTFIF